MPTKSASKIITREPGWLGPAIHPGEMLLEEFLKPMGLAQTDAARRLGIVYGPYLGLTCRRQGGRRCGEVGIDVVLREEARAVTAWVGGRRLSLRTPGLHSGVAGRDWVGYLRRVGLDRPESPFYLPTRHTASWAGSPPVYVPVRLKITHPDDSAKVATLTRVFLSPGWG